MAALMLGRRHRYDGLGVVTTLAKEYGASDRNRTRDHRFTRAALYQLSYRGMSPRGDVEHCGTYHRCGVNHLNAEAR